MRVLMLTIIIAGFSEQSGAQLLCHEMGHANGWPSNHGAL